MSCWWLLPQPLHPTQCPLTQCPAAGRDTHRAQGMHSLPFIKNPALQEHTVFCFSLPVGRGAVQIKEDRPAPGGPEGEPGGAGVDGQSRDIPTDFESGKDRKCCLWSRGTKRGRPSPGDRAHPCGEDRDGVSGVRSQGTRTVPLRQGLQFTHRKRVSPEYSRYCSFLQPHTVSRSTVQEEISTWPISGEGKRRGMSLSLEHTPTPMHSVRNPFPQPGAQSRMPSQVGRHAHPSQCPTGPSHVQSLPSPETHLLGILNS